MSIRPTFTSALLLSVCACAPDSGGSSFAVPVEQGQGGSTSGQGGTSSGGSSNGSGNESGSSVTSPPPSKHQVVATIPDFVSMTVLDDEAIYFVKRGTTDQFSTTSKWWGYRLAVGASGQPEEIFTTLKQTQWLTRDESGYYLTEDQDWDDKNNGWSTAVVRLDYGSTTIKPFAKPGSTNGDTVLLTQTKDALYLADLADSGFGVVTRNAKPNGAAFVYASGSQGHPGAAWVEGDAFWWISEPWQQTRALMSAPAAGGAAKKVADLPDLCFYYRIGVSTVGFCTANKTTSFVSVKNDGTYEVVKTGLTQSPVYQHVFATADALYWGPYDTGKVRWITANGDLHEMAIPPKGFVFGVVGGFVYSVEAKTVYRTPLP